MDKNLSYQHKFFFSHKDNKKSPAGAGSISY
jgi:hypothetical protein